MFNKKMLILVISVILFSSLLSVTASDDLNNNITDSVNLSSDNHIKENTSFHIENNSTGKISHSTKENILGDDIREIKSSKNIVITNDTFNTYFTDHYLNDKVSEGDVLDFRGCFYGNEYSMNINKAVNITSTTNDAYINLNTTANDWFGEDDVSSFTITKSGAYTNVSNIYFYNSQIFVKNSHHIIFNNISAIVEKSTVGRGVGQTSIRDNSSFITIENSTFSTKDQWAGCGLVLAWANNCTIRYNKLIGIGEVGNLFYLTTFNVESDMPRSRDGNLDYNLINVNNTFENNLLIGPDHPQAMCYIICLSGTNNRIINNTILNYTGNGISVQAYSFDYDMKTLIANNTLIGCNFFMPNGSYAINNTVTGNFTLGARSIIENNTFKNVKLVYDNLELSNTKADNIIINTGKQNITITNSTVTNNITIIGSGLGDIPTKITIKDSICENIIVNASKNLTIQNNSISNQIILSSKNNMNNNITITDNAIINNEEYTILVKKRVRGLNITNNYLLSSNKTGNESIYINTIYDEYNIKNDMTHIRLNDTNYELFFDKDGLMKNSVEANITIELAGNLYDKKLILTNQNVTFLNPQSYTLYNSKISIIENFNTHIAGLNIINTNTADAPITIDDSTNVIVTNTTIESDTSISINNSENILIENNNITVNNANTIEILNSNNLTITHNSLYAKILNGDKSVNTSNSKTYIYDNIPSDNDGYVLIVDTNKFTIGTNTQITASIYKTDNTLAKEISNGKVIFKINGKTLKDDNGKVIYARVINATAKIENYRIPEGWNKKNITIEAVYSGFMQYDALRSRKITLTITEKAPVITTEDITTNASNTIQLKATVNDNNMANAKIIFKINGKTVKDAGGKIIYAKIINNTAVIEYKLPSSLKKGRYNLTVIYKKTGYEKIEDTKTITVN